MYQPLVPFLPVISNGGSLASGASASGTDTTHDVWSNYPGRCDLTFYQGDDVTIPLTIEDPSDATPDMSTAWDWVAQIRVIHSYRLNTPQHVLGGR